MIGIPSVRPFPDEVDYPFFLTYFPQTRKRYPSRDWLERVVLQPETATKSTTKRSERGLWKEFAHNVDVLQFRDDVKEYKQRLRKLR